MKSLHIAFKDIQIILKDRGMIINLFVIQHSLGWFDERR